MEPVTLGVVGLVALVGLIAIRIPVAYAMILMGGVGVALVNGLMLLMSQFKTLGWGVFSNYGLSVVPMFVLMGALASRAGLSQDLFRGANAWLGRMRGGAAVAAIAGCAGFGAVCGSSLATASTMGRVALPELKRYGYSGALATGTLAAGGVLGILIPPSVVLIIYAIIVEANIVTMFAAALIPGFLAVVLFILTIAVYVAIRPEAGPRSAGVDGAEFRRATLGLIPVMVIFGIVLGGIYGGFFNPTPAAAVGVALVGLYGGLSRGAEGPGFGMSTEDLKIWFGILALIVVELGLITPPVGMNVFVISAVARDVPMIETTKGVMPFFAAEILRVGAILALPGLTLWLPALL